MITTIDQAGRVVIPKTLRQKFHLDARTEIEIVPDGDGLRLRVPRQGSVLLEKDGLLIHSTGMKSDVDATAFINQLREEDAVKHLSGTSS
jgi:AbrB family looped-hinge helix DNA binding protein